MTVLDDSDYNIVKEYILILKDELIDIFLDENEIRSICNRTNCQIELTNRILNRKVGGFKIMKYAIVQVRGKDDYSIRQCNRLLEQRCPQYRTRQEYNKKTYCCTLFPEEMAPDNATLYFQYQRSGAATYQFGNILLKSPYEANCKRNMDECYWKSTDCDLKRGIVVSSSKQAENCFSHYLKNSISNQDAFKEKSYSGYYFSRPNGDEDLNQGCDKNKSNKMNKFNDYSKSKEMYLYQDMLDKSLVEDFGTKGNTGDFSSSKNKQLEQVRDIKSFGNETKGNKNSDLKSSTNEYKNISNIKKYKDSTSKTNEIQRFEKNNEKTADKSYIKGDKMKSSKKESSPQTSTIITKPGANVDVIEDNSFPDEKSSIKYISDKNIHDDNEGLYVINTIDMENYTPTDGPKNSLVDVIVLDEESTKGSLYSNKINSIKPERKQPPGKESEYTGTIDVQYNDENIIEPTHHSSREVDANQEYQRENLPKSSSRTMQVYVSPTQTKQIDETTRQNIDKASLKGSEKSNLNVMNKKVDNLDFNDQQPSKIEVNFGTQSFNDQIEVNQLNLQEFSVANKYEQITYQITISPLESRTSLMKTNPTNMYSNERASNSESVQRYDLINLDESSVKSTRSKNQLKVYNIQPNFDMETLVTEIKISFQDFNVPVREISDSNSKLTNQNESSIEIKTTITTKEVLFLDEDKISSIKSLSPLTDRNRSEIDPFLSPNEYQINSPGLVAPVNDLNFAESRETIPRRSQTFKLVKTVEGSDASNSRKENIILTNNESGINIMTSFLSDDKNSYKVDVIIRDNTFQQMNDLSISKVEADIQSPILDTNCETFTFSRKPIALETGHYLDDGYGALSEFPIRAKNPNSYTTELIESPSEILLRSEKLNDSFSSRMSKCFSFNKIKKEKIKDDSKNNKPEPLSPQKSTNFSSTNEGSKHFKTLESIDDQDKYDKERTKTKRIRKIKSEDEVFCEASESQPVSDVSNNAQNSVNNQQKESKKNVRNNPALETVTKLENLSGMDLLVQQISDKLMIDISCLNNENMNYPEIMEVDSDSQSSETLFSLNFEIPMIAKESSANADNSNIVNENNLQLLNNSFSSDLFTLTKLMDSKDDANQKTYNYTPSVSPNSFLNSNFSNSTDQFPVFVSKYFDDFNFSSDIKNSPIKPLVDSKRKKHLKFAMLHDFNRLSPILETSDFYKTGLHLRRFVNHVSHPSPTPNHYVDRIYESEILNRIAEICKTEKRYFSKINKQLRDFSTSNSEENISNSSFSNRFYVPYLKSRIHMTIQDSSTLLYNQIPKITQIDLLKAQIQQNFKGSKYGYKSPSKQNPSPKIIYKYQTDEYLQNLMSQKPKKTVPINFPANNWSEADFCKFKNRFARLENKMISEISLKDESDSTETVTPLSQVLESFNNEPINNFYYSRNLLEGLKRDNTFEKIQNWIIGNHYSQG